MVEQIGRVDRPTRSFRDARETEREARVDQRGRWNGLIRVAARWRRGRADLPGTGEVDVAHIDARVNREPSGVAGAQLRLEVASRVVEAKRQRAFVLRRVEAQRTP